MVKSFVYVGCCNRPTPHFATSNGPGIALFTLDAAGTLEPAGMVEGIDNPTFLSTDPSGSHLYANSEVYGWAEGTVTAYRIEPRTGWLTYLNKQAALGGITAFNSLDREGRHLLVANYGMGPVGEGPDRALAVFPRDADGRLLPCVSSAAHAGKGHNPDRQERSHAHAVRVSPDNRFALVTDLGLDRIAVYRFDAATGAVDHAHDCPLPAGSGPRHFVFDAAGTRLHVVNELDSSVSALSYDAESGRLALIDSCSTLPSDAPPSHCSEITLAPSGHRLFVANRGHDSIATLAVDPKTGALRRERTIPSGGRTPRHMAVDPSGRFLLVANQDSDQVNVFHIAGDAEALEPVGSARTGTPMCIAFAQPRSP